MDCLNERLRLLIAYDIAYLNEFTKTAVTPQGDAVDPTKSGGINERKQTASQFCFFKVCQIVGLGRRYGALKLIQIFKLVVFCECYSLSCRIKSEKPTTPGIPRRSPIQVLTRPNVA